MVHKSTQIFPQAEGVATLNGLTGEVTLAGGHAIAVTTDSGTDTITTAFNGGLDDLNDVDLFGVVTGDVLLKGPGSWINYPLGTITSGFVPYTGASANVNLGSNTLTAATVSTDTVIAENLYFNSVPFNSLICTSPSSGQLAAVTIGSNLSFAAGTLAVTGAALTKTDDANVTLTLGGGASSSVLSATSLTLGWTGTLAATRGGTGFGSYAVGDILYANTTTTLAKLADVATGNVLLSGGVGVAPSWGKVSASGAITGVLPIANGGTNTDTQTASGICYYDGSKITTSSNATLSFIAGDVDLLISHPSVAGTTYEVLVTSSSSQYLMAYNTVSTFQGICGTGATENYWTLSTAGLGLYVSASSLWFGSTSNNDLSLYRNNTERLRLTTTGIYVPDVAYLSAASPTINAMVTGTTLIQSSVRLISAYSGAASANSSYFLGSGNDGGLLQLFGAGGTIASPTALTTDSRMGGVFGRGYAATGYSNAVAGVTFHAESTFTDTSTPTYIAFATTASGATTRTEAMRITSAGNVMIGTSTSAWAGNPRFQAKGNGLFFSTDASTVGILLYDKRATEKYWYLAHKPSDSSFYINHWNGGSDSYPFTITTGGNVLIGATSASGKLTVSNAGVSGTGLAILSGGATNYVALTMGRTGIDGALGVAGGSGEFSSSAVQGDFIIRAESSSKALLLQAGSGSAVVYVTSTNVGVNCTPSFRFHVNENQGYTSRAANPLPAQLVVQSGASGFLKIGNYYTGGVGTCSAIQSTDLFSGTDHGTNLLLNPLGGNVGIGEDAPNFTLVARYASAYPQISARYDGTSASNYKELQLGYNGSSGSGYAWIQALHNGTGYTPICLNPYGSDVIIGGLSTPRAKLEVVGDIWTDWEDRFIGTVYQAGAAYKMGIKATTGVRALDLIAMSADSSSIRFWTGATPSVNAYIDHVSNVVLGNQSALATNATNGFLYVRTCAGTPTGAPTAFTGHVAMLYDTTNNKWWAYNGSWRSVTLT